MQSQLYKRTQNVDYLANFPGADPTANVVQAVLDGAVDIASLPEPVETAVAAALASDGSDSLLVDSNDPIDVSASTVPVEQQTTVAIEGTDGTQTDPATETTLSSLTGALVSDGSDGFLIGVEQWSAGTLSVQEDTALDVSGATVPVDHQGVIDVSSRDGRNLGSVDVTALPDADSNSWNGAALDADSSLTLSLSAIGADRLRGRVWSDNQYSVEIDVKDSAGNVIETLAHADAVAGGTKTDVSLEALAPQYDVRILEGASAASTANGTVMLA